MIKVWGVIKSCANVLVVLRNSPPPTKKMVRVGVIYDGACMYDILSKLEHPVIFGGQPLVFLHGPMVRDAETDPMSVSVAFGVFVPSLGTTCQSELLLKFAQIFRFLSVFEILTPQTIKITCPKKYSIRKQEQKSYLHPHPLHFVNATSVPQNRRRVCWPKSELPKFLPS